MNLVKKIIKASDPSYLQLFFFIVNWYQRKILLNKAHLNVYGPNLRSINHHNHYWSIKKTLLTYCILPSVILLKRAFYVHQNAAAPLCVNIPPAPSAFLLDLILRCYLDISRGVGIGHISYSCCSRSGISQEFKARIKLKIVLIVLQYLVKRKFWSFGRIFIICPN